MMVDHSERTGSRGSDHDRLVERLIRLADVGPQIPEGGPDRVRAVIRPAWCAEVRARRRRRFVAWAGALAAAAGVVLGLIAVLAGRDQDASPELVASVDMVRGELEVIPLSGAPIRLGGDAVAHDVTTGSWLRTGPSSRAALLLRGGQSLRIDSSTRLRLRAGAADLSRGAVYVDSGPTAGSGIEVRTELGVARDIGTQFEVRQHDRGVTVRVREGTVELDQPDATVVITEGTELTAVADGTHETRRIPANDPLWSWVVEAAPPLEIEGRSLLAFLDWVSRETGLWISFADPETEHVAETTVLHGAIEGLTPAQAPEVVLPGCGLVGVVDGGTLLVRRQSAPDRGPPGPVADH